MAQLTPGSIANLVAGVTGQPLTVQVLGVKRLQNAQSVAPERFRMLLSDGEYSHSCMLATQLTELVTSGQLKEGAIIVLHDYICNQVQNKKVVIVLNLEIVQPDAEKVGNPQLYDKAVAAAAPAGAGAPPPVENGGAAGGYGGPPPQQQYGGGPPAGGYGGAPAGGAPAGGYGGAPPGGPAGYGGGPPAGAGGYGGGPPAGPGGYGGAAPGGPYGGGAPPAPAQYGAPPGPQYRGSGPVARNEAPSHIMPINALNSYQNRWTIKARVTQKSDIRRYSNARGEGRFFSFDLLDAQGGEIRVVGWNDQCDRWEPQVEQGKVYLISKCSLRHKRGNFNQTRHQFEIHLENQSQVELCPDEDDIPQLFFNFTKISTVEDTPPNNMVDLCAVVESCMDASTITRRDGTEVQKRPIILRDDSGRSIELTLWGKYVTESGDALSMALQQGTKPVVAIKNARVGEYNGKTLSTVGGTSILIDPLDVPEAMAMRQWYDSGGAAQAAEPLSRQGGGGGRSDRRVTLAQIKDEGMGMGERPEWVQVNAAVTYLRSENMYYPACTGKVGDRQCNKKLQDNGNGGWYCERCGGEYEPEFRYMISMTLSDHTGETWATAFQEQGLDIMGKPALEIKEMRDTLGDTEFGAYMSDLTFRHYVFKLKLASETYNDETKLRVNVSQVAPLSFSQESKKLIEQIGMLDRGQDPLAAPAPGGQQAQQAGGYGGGYGAAPQQQQQGGGYGGAGYGGAGGAQGGYGGGGGPQGGYGGGGGAYGGAPQQQQWGGGAAGAGGDFKTPPNRGQGQGGYGGAPGGYPQNQNNNQNQWGQQQGGGGYGGGGAGAPGYNANPANFY